MTSTRAIFVMVATCALVASADAQTRVAPVEGGTLAERYQRAEAALDEARDKAAETLAERDRIAAEEAPLQEKLVDAAGRLQQLEQSAAENASELDRLNERVRDLNTQLAQDQRGLVQVLALMQRIRAAEKAGAFSQPDDAVRGIRALLQAGGALKPLYRGTSVLAGELKSLASLQTQVARRQAEADRRQQALKDARDGLDRLISDKRAQEAGLTDKAEELRIVVEDIGRDAAGLKALMDRIASLRATGTDGLPRVKAVGPGSRPPATLVRGALRPPVPGKSTPGDPAGPGLTPGATGPTGLWFEGTGHIEAVAPADSEVVFAGNYQKLGQVLILELAGGYHLALAGLGRIDVHVGDLVLAGEPVGTLPDGKAAPLYMELRRNGKVVDLAPWVSADIGKAKGT